jgi:hypothetical protein
VPDSPRLKQWADADIFPTPAFLYVTGAAASRTISGGYGAYSTAFGVLNLLDAGLDRYAVGETPFRSWRDTDAEGNLTGRAVEGMHESLLSIPEEAVKAGLEPSV